MKNTQTNIEDIFTLLNLFKIKLAIENKIFIACIGVKMGFITYIEVKYNDNRTNDGKRFLPYVQNHIILFEGGLW